MKIIIGLAIFIFCIIFGFLRSNFYIKKRQYYFDFYSFNKKLKNEIYFLQKPLLEIIKNDKKTDFIICLEKYFDTNEFIFNKDYLTDEEKDFLKNYLNIIGKGDSTSQIQYIETVAEQIDVNYEKSKEDEKKYKPLYIKMSFLIGLMFFILFL